MAHSVSKALRRCGLPRSGSMNCTGVTGPPSKADCPATMKPSDSSGSAIICATAPSRGTSEATMATTRKQTNMAAKASGRRANSRKASPIQRGPREASTDLSESAMQAGSDQVV